MPIAPFQIINPDGTTNQSEYDRCIEFLQQYVGGTINVYGEVTWTNPFEVDMTQEKSSYTMLREILFQSTNRLLNRTTFDSIKKLFKGTVTGLGRTIHPIGNFLELSKDFIDGPGYMYDVFTADETEVKLDTTFNSTYPNQETYDFRIFWLDDDYHTTIQIYPYPMKSYWTDADYTPTMNIPKNGVLLPAIDTQNCLTDVYKSDRTSGIYSDFQMQVGEHLQSSVLFYYSQCSSPLYTSGGASYYEPEIDEIINFTRNAVIGTSSKPAQGLDLSQVTTARNAISFPKQLNAYIDPSTINPNQPYNAPNFFSAANATDWNVYYSEPES